MNRDTKTKHKFKFSISLDELKTCPKLILSPSHWRPVHKVEECGADKPQVIKKKKTKQPPKMYQNKYQDIKKVCVQCNEEFIWTGGEQKFMNQLFEEGKIKAVIEPKRCPDCRKEKKARFDNRFAQHDSY